MSKQIQLRQVVATPGAIAAFEESDEQPSAFLWRHACGDWGELREADREEHELSLVNGFRLLSSYTLSSGKRIWVITECDRSCTTLLVADEILFYSQTLLRN